MLAMPKQNETAQKIQHKHELAIVMHQSMRLDESSNELVWVWPSFSMSGKPIKRKKITMNQQEAVTALNGILDDSPILALFTKEGDVKTKRVNECHEKLNNIANLVTSAVHSGKIKTNADLAKAQSDKIMMMKEHLVLKNIEAHCVDSDEAARVKARAQIIESMVHETKKNQTTTESQTQLQAAWRNCLNDMQLVDQWAHGVWQKHKVAIV